MKIENWTQASEFFSLLYVNRQTAAQMRLACRHLSELCERPADLDVLTVARFIRRELPRQRSTSVRSLLRAIKTIAAKLNALGVIAVDPFKVQKFVVPYEQNLDRSLTLGDVARALRQADAEAADLAAAESLASLRLPTVRGRRSPAWKARRLRALLYLLSHTGVRAAEALHLQPGDLVLRERDEETGAVYSGVHIRSSKEHRTKTKASADVVPLPDAAAGVLLDWLPDCGGVWVFPCSSRPDRPWTSGGPGQKPYEQLKALGRRAGCKGSLTLLSQRHTFATCARTFWRLTRDDVQTILRHESPEMQTKHYVHARLSELAPMVRGVSYSQGGA